MEFDYIVIGAGSAGCSIAARLSEDPAVRVALVEAGKPDTDFMIHMPLGYGKTTSEPGESWHYRSAAEPGLDGRTMLLPRGKGLGGSSNINGMIYIRGQAADYDGWAQLGATGWGWAEVLPWFRKAQTHAWGASDLRGGEGPLWTEPFTMHDDTSRATLRAFREWGAPENEDFNGADQHGAGWFHVNIKDGRRWSAATAYLKPAAKRANLEVMTGVHTRRIVFAGKRASGIEAQRGVGLRLVWNVLRYLATRKGVMTIPAAEVGAFLKSDPALDAPDIQFHCLPVSGDVSATAAGGKAKVSPFPGLTLAPCQLRPESRGVAQAASPDPFAVPHIVHNYLAAAEDQRIALAGMRIAREVAASPPLAALILSESDPGLAKQSEEALLAHARLAGSTGYHPVGTCRMGADADAVTDPQLRVRGVEGLRVADASVMPRLVSGNTHATAVMIGERAADLIRKTGETRVVGEITTCTLHNILTPRGALVRNALRWSGYLDEALTLYAERSDQLVASHCWPRFGTGVVKNYLAVQRDNYKFLHDQTVRMMNNGETAPEIAEVRRAVARGDYRWAVDVLNHLVFAQPQNTQARALLADSHEQLGYQAESSLWRNMYLEATLEPHSNPADLPPRS